MLQDTISRIEARLRDPDGLKEDQRNELLGLLAKLKAEVNSLSRTHTEQADSIAGFTEVSTHEALRQKKDPRLLQLSIQGLNSSVEGFESSHPELVGVVNRICTMLSNMGI